MRVHKVVLVVVLMGILLACGNKKSRLSGAPIEVSGIQREYVPEKPFGMTEIEGGSFSIGTPNDDMTEPRDYTPTVLVPSFFMDEAEINNEQYREFVNWVRDSIARELLALKVQELGADNLSEGIGQFAFQDKSDVESSSEYKQYMIKQYGEDFPDTYKINWDVKLFWDFKKYPDQYYAQVMDSFYLHPSKWVMGKPKLDVKKFKYRYTIPQRDLPLNNSTSSDTFLNFEPFISEEVIGVYPDTTVWIKDSHYFYSEPMHYNYFWHPAYSEYPVVGVNWHQANAFCAWRTQNRNNSNVSGVKQVIPQYRLPTEIEWEYAAKAGEGELDSIIYPWGTNQLTDDGRFLANFKLRRDKKGLYTVHVRAYKPNRKNLYNMAGNVAEWTLTSYNDRESFTPSVNPNINDKTDERKVIKGGSWKDVASYLKITSRDSEYANIARSFIGFRTVQDYPKNFSKEDFE
ncbi:MAG: SUMF1/EgtB/PvdO family nonheme iron enzyme [Flavobacteriaceae bacterium]|nr:SUMF1/EgtB/PvdO family nonheme iron enzyme [Flavobacteriaceae bacterium]